MAYAEIGQIATRYRNQYRIGVYPHIVTVVAQAHTQ